MERFETINPATGETLARFDAASSTDIERALVAAAEAAARWRASSLQERADLLNRLASELRARQSDLARAMSLEMGKPLTEANAEIEKSAWNCEHVAAEGPGWLKDEPVISSPRECYVRRRPIGTLFAVMPWNFPVWQVFRFLPLALMAGNGVILKHAPNVQWSAQNIVDLCASAGVPDGLFQNLRASIEDIPGIIRDRRIAAVTLTGSGRAGAAVAAIAGSALKKSVLELGGSDPFIVLSDADLEAAAKTAVAGRYANCGQICLAPKRFIVDRSVREEFVERFIGLADQLVTGDPLEQGVGMGPMARGDLREQLHSQVTRSVEMGARVLLGGTPAEGPGSFYPPTVLEAITLDMPVAREEIFGPVAVMMTAESDAEIIRIADSTQYGLSSNIWSRDQERAMRIADRLDVGGVFVNGASASDPRLPVGGSRASGYGRELGPWGFDEFVNIQTVSLG